MIFGDHLDADAPLLRALDKARDTILMIEAAGESLHVASHVQRTVLFLAAMRHFAAELRSRGFRVRYIALDDPGNTQGLATEIERAARHLGPTEIVCTQPGEWRVETDLRECAAGLRVPLRILPDEHFIASREQFAAWAHGRRSLTMEYFYREQRRRTGYLLDSQGRPEGGTWNFDHDNREAFGPGGPNPPPPPPRRFAPDAVTRAVIAAVQDRLPDLPGRLARPDDFGWPVTRDQALGALDDFITHRLALFGRYEDAMWTGTPFVYHSALSPALNLKLLNPRECCQAAIAAYRDGRAPLASVEAFVRQIIGWREFIRGIYWLEGPAYAERNGLDQHGRLPGFYWTGQTDMACMRDAIGQVLDHGYGHHIQRLMVTGNFALISGVHPRAITDWYLRMYVDAVDWVTLPNTLGMVMHADRRPSSPAAATGLVGTKPYAASGRYIQRMSNACRGCRFDPAQRRGENACPFTVFYWDFLIRNGTRLAANHRMGVILKNVDALTGGMRTEITVSAARLRKQFGIEVAAPVP